MCLYPSKVLLFQSNSVFFRISTMAGHMVLQQNRHEKEKGLSYYHNPGTKPLRVITVGQLINEAVEKTPERDAIISYYEKKKLNFQQVKNETDRLAAGFLKLGLKPGDRIAFIGVNSIHWYISMLAAAKIGLIVVMLNPGYRTKELGYAFKKASPIALVTDRSFKTQDYIMMLNELVPSMSSATHGKPLNFPEETSLNYIIVATEEKLPGCYRIQDVCKLSTDFDALRDVERSVQPDDPLCIQFSSGTTGEPKPALLSHLSIINSAGNFGRGIDQHEKVKIVCVQVPFFHIFGTACGIIFGLYFTCTMLIPSPIFSKDLTTQALHHYKLDLLLGTPTMLFDLYVELKKRLPDDPKLKEGCEALSLIGTGGAVVSQDLNAKMKEVFPNTVLGGIYGMTEAGCIFVLMLKDDTEESKELRLGYPCDYIELKIVDEDGKMVPFGTPGEAWYRSVSNLLEYWGDEKKTKAAKDSAGWFKSGDIIVLREDGYCLLKGRKKEIIIRGGENIFPSEIENFLQEHPQILKSEVFGIEDERLGEEIAVSIKLKPSATLDEPSLREYCKGKISHYKIPKYIRFVEQYPLTSTGKVAKLLLKQMLEKELKAKK